MMWPWFRSAAHLDTRAIFEAVRDSCMNSPLFSTSLGTLFLYTSSLTALLLNLTIILLPPPSQCAVFRHQLGKRTPVWKLMRRMTSSRMLTFGLMFSFPRRMRQSPRLYCSAASACRSATPTFFSSLSIFSCWLIIKRFSSSKLRVSDMMFLPIKRNKVQPSKCSKIAPFLSNLSTNH